MTDEFDQTNDERLVRRGPGRPRRDAATDPRMNRDVADRLAEDRSLSDPVRMEAYQDMDDYQMPVLPNPEPIPGFHCCWISTQNPQDTPFNRMRFGYEFVTDAEQPMLAHSKLRDGQYAGHISLNEMVLMKIPMDRYQAMMNRQHHIKPMEQRERLNAHVAAFADKLRQSGMRLYQGDNDAAGDAKDGFQELRQRLPATARFERV